MSTGALDAQGIWQYGEDDPASPFSNLLNLLAEAVSTQIAADRARLAALEAEGTSTNWTPAFTNLTVGNGTLVAKYGRVGDVVTWSLVLVFGSTTSVSGTVACTLPTLVSTGVWTAVGDGYIARGSTTAGRTPVTTRMTGSTTFNVWYTGNSMNATSPLTGGTWAAGDVLALGGSYLA